jgi:hypothetical protein
MQKSVQKNRSADDEKTFIYCLWLCILPLQETAVLNTHLAEKEGKVLLRLEQTMHEYLIVS